ncbi:MAG: hypothetical protein ACYDFT_02450 [Thermoplasmata archaeon]
MAPETAPPTPVSPLEIRIEGAHPLVRTVRQDPRGFLVETLRSDDPGVDAERFRMSYTSLTVPGQFRDVDRWHVHKVQTDRFVVVMGEMTLALLDGRKGSPTEGLLDVVRFAGVPWDAPTHPAARDHPAYLVPIPPGVLHSLGNLAAFPFLYQNYPTELYSPADEGRVPFSSLPVASIGGPFSWSLLGTAQVRR